MRLPSAILAAAFVLLPAGAMAQQSCYDLWYERNAIFADYGYCFSTDLGLRTFSNAGCFTKTPSLSRADQRRVDAIRAEERRRGCRVN